MRCFMHSIKKEAGWCPCALSALLESLMAFVIADLDESVIASIERFHQRRYDLGIYLEENT